MPSVIPARLTAHGAYVTECGRDATRELIVKVDPPLTISVFFPGKVSETFCMKTVPSDNPFDKLAKWIDNMMAVHQGVARECAARREADDALVHTHNFTALRGKPVNKRPDGK